MELHPPHQLNGLPAVADVLLRYLNRLPLAGERRAVVFADALAHGGSVGRALARVHAALAPDASTAVNAAHASIGARLRLAVGAAGEPAQVPVTRDLQGRERLETTPRLARSPMAPHGWLGSARRTRNSAAGDDDDDIDGPDSSAAARDTGRRWRHHASRRRWVLAGLIVAQTIIATDYMARVLPYHGTKA